MSMFEQSSKCKVQQRDLKLDLDEAAILAGEKPPFLGHLVFLGLHFDHFLTLTQITLIHMSGHTREIKEDWTLTF